MKTCKTLLRLVAAVLLTTGLNGCQDYEIPEANLRLSYPAGETVVGTASYTSAVPSVRSTSTPTFAITARTCSVGGTDMTASNVKRIGIQPQTGAIRFEWIEERPAIPCEYLVSVSVTNNSGTTEYPDAFRLVVKGLVFDKGVTTKGEAKTFEIERSYLVQEEGSVFKLVKPLNDINGDYNHFTIDTLSCAVTVDAEAPAGVYPVSIKVTNRTNPNGVVFNDVLSVTVESKPYELTYTPAAITLMNKEGHSSAAPFVRSASAEKGSETVFSLVDNYGIFSINSQTGVITLPKGQTLAPTEIKSFEFDVTAQNPLGETTFSKAYTITVDPNKTADPVTSITYPDAFPVTLQPGQAWTSGVPIITGAAVNLAYSLIDAPKGISIDAETGVITMAANHYLPLKTDNKLTVQAINIAMITPFEAKIGSFAVTAPEALWTVTFHPNDSGTAVTDSGIDAMDRYTFSGQIQNNQSTNKPASHQVVKNAFGRAANPVLDFIDFVGVNNANTWAGHTNQNNDWLVSPEVVVPTASSTFLTPYITFKLAFQYGTDAQNIIEVYAIEVNAANVYTKGEQNQDTKGMSAVPSDLPWEALATSDKDNSAITNKIVFKSGLANLADNMIDLSAYRGKTIRFALRCWNPSAADSNSRTWRIGSLCVQHDIPQN